MPRIRPGVLLSIFLLVGPTAAVCDTFNIGLISYDLLIPGDTNLPGTNVFNILNLTGDPSSGGFALPPDFPVIDSLTFLNSSLTLFDGGSPIVILLGDLGPGALDPTDPVQVPAGSLFSAAVFSATLSQTQFLLSDGSTFTAGSSAVSATILPSSDTSLTAGTDFALIAVSSVPEPSSVLLLGAIAVILIGNQQKIRA
jgi:hypothetical protein